jgi:hypothetical protein
MLFAAAFFVFKAAPAWAGIIPAYLWCFTYHLFWFWHNTIHEYPFTVYLFK